MVREALNTVTGHPMTILQYQPKEIEKALQGFSIPGFFAKAGGHCNLVFDCPKHEITKRRCQNFFYSEVLNKSTAVIKVPQPKI